MSFSSFFAAFSSFFFALAAAFSFFFSAFCSFFTSLALAFSAFFSAFDGFFGAGFFSSFFFLVTRATSFNACSAAARRTRSSPKDRLESLRKLASRRARRPLRVSARSS